MSASHDGAAAGTNCPHHTRRRFLLSAVWAGSAALLGPSVGAAAGALPHLSPSAPLAKSLGFTDDASTVNRTRFPTYKPGERCEKCRFFQGAPGEAWGPCEVFKGYAVNARGWCLSFVAKPPSKAG
jgi:hypothetical protein